MPRAVDPLGSDVLVPGCAKKAIEISLITSQVYGFEISEEPNGMARVSGSATSAEGDLRGEIIASMISADGDYRTFEIDGEDYGSTWKNWMLHVDSRKNAVEFANSARFAFGPPSFPKELYQDLGDGLIIPKDNYDAIIAPWKQPNKHSFYCLRGSLFCMNAGIAKAMGRDWYNKHGNQYLLTPEIGKYYDAKFMHFDMGFWLASSFLMIIIESKPVIR